MMIFCMDRAMKRFLFSVFQSMMRRSGPQPGFHLFFHAQGQHGIGEAHLDAEDGLAGVAQALGVLERNEGQARVVLLKAEGRGADDAESIGAGRGLEAT
jgi:hypothetical protein